MDRNVDGMSLSSAQILVESLEKKSRILDEIMEENAAQERLFKQEDKLNAYIDKWYAKFSAMETALAKLESKNSSLSSLFGG